MKNNKINSESAFVSKKENRFLTIVRQFCGNRGAVVGLIIVVFLIVISLLSDYIWDYKTDVIGMNVKDRLIGPCLEHPFGTDQFGRDMLARVGYGTRYSLVISFCAICCSLIIGVPIGAAAGYYGGKFEFVVMRVIDAITSIPSILLTIVLVTVLGTSTVNLIIALSISSIPILARITRATVLTVKNNEYIEAARAIPGASDFYIIRRHVIPNCFSPILVASTVRMGNVIISASSLSYIGLGVPVPTPEWGALLNASKDFILDKPYLCMFPGIAIMITVMAINLMGDGLRDALDPKLKR